jgi:hypothetical protein
MGTFLNSSIGVKQFPVPSDSTFVWKREKISRYIPFLEYAHYNELMH